MLAEKDKVTKVFVYLHYDDFWLFDPKLQIDVTEKALAGSFKNSGFKYS